LRHTPWLEKRAGTSNGEQYGMLAVSRHELDGDIADCQIYNGWHKPI
jgi:hypothetical protein